MRRRIFDGEGHGYFVTFSCYRRRRLLDEDRAKRIVIHFLDSPLSSQQGECVGLVIMPDHVHALVRFGEKGRLSLRGGTGNSLPVSCGPDRVRPSQVVDLVRK